MKITRSLLERAEIEARWAAVRRAQARWGAVLSGRDPDEEEPDPRQLALPLETE